MFKVMRDFYLKCKGPALRHLTALVVCEEIPTMYVGSKVSTPTLGLRTPDH